MIRCYGILEHVQVETVNSRILYVSYNFSPNLIAKIYSVQLGTCKFEELTASFLAPSAISDIQDEGKKNDNMNTLCYMVTIFIYTCIQLSSCIFYLKTNSNFTEFSISSMNQRSRRCNLTVVSHLPACTLRPNLD